ncbi:MAG: hypothetical protein WCT19_04230 [Candidatus Paceibacterota bacterium]|jgi:uncharacterized protein (UPF0248 family)
MKTVRNAGMTRVFGLVIIASIFILAIGWNSMIRSMIHRGKRGLLTEDTQKQNSQTNRFTTIGNDTYIPLPIHFRTSGTYVAENESLVFAKELADCFSKAHPELEIVGWRFERDASGSTLYGIWLHHRVRSTNLRTILEKY